MEAGFELEAPAAVAAAIATHTIKRAESSPSPRRTVGEAGEQDAHLAPLPFRIDRRTEARRATYGFAQVLVLDPLRIFLGGAMPLSDISAHGMRLLCDHAIPAGEHVEVRLAPFRTRGRIGVVARCDALRSDTGSDAETGASAEARAPRFTIGVHFERRRGAA